MNPALLPPLARALALLPPHMGHNGGPPLVPPPAPPPVPEVRPMRARDALLILALCDMTERGFARRIKTTPSRARRMLSGETKIPASVAKWLWQLEIDTRANPAPNMGGARS